MKLRGMAVKVGVSFAVLFAGFALGTSVTSTVAKKPAAKPPLVWVDLSGTAAAKPDFIFFSANSGSQVRNIKWNRWGKNRSVGRGHYQVTSPPPPGETNPKGPARIVAWKPVRCVPEFGNRKGKVLRVYRHAKMLRPVPEGGRKWVDISDYTGRLTCR